MSTKISNSKQTEKMDGIDFIRLAKPMGLLSLLLVIGSVILIMTKGFNYGIDFSGGTEMHVKFTKSVTAEEVRAALAEVGAGGASVQTFGEANEFLVRLGTPELPDAAAQNKALKRRRRQCRLDKDEQLREFVLTKLQCHYWTPEQIAAWLKHRQTEIASISHESIYAWTYRHAQKKNKL